MREDMFNVIVERPRRGSRWIDSSAGRRYRASEEVPVKQGMRQGYERRKYLNENLSPLRRFLESQVNRPWDKVYADICAGIDRRNTVQEHIFAHIDDFVVRHARLIDGQVYVAGRWSGYELEALAGSSVKLYVHPRTGLLLRNRHYKAWNDMRKQAREREAAEQAARRRVLNERELLLLIEGIWYRVELAPLPSCTYREVHDRGRTRTITECEMRWDVVRKTTVAAGEKADQAYDLYGRWGVYAATKRQLGQRELRKHGLQQKGREDSRPFFHASAPAQFKPARPAFALAGFQGTSRPFIDCRP